MYDLILVHVLSILYLINHDLLLINVLNILYLAGLLLLNSWREKIKI